MVGEVLERLGVPDLVVGSMASTRYGEPRSTNDIDLGTRLELILARLTTPNGMDSPTT